MKLIKDHILALKSPKILEIPTFYCNYSNSDWSRSDFFNQNEKLSALPAAKVQYIILFSIPDFKVSGSRYFGN